ncbi:MAG: AAA family ATPase [Chloroflexi bacterium]|nr:AAA family ATPase [Chloroflexota bacterium]
MKGLFGMFDHEIPLNQESRITIVHGPNGVGKTVLLRMLHGLFNFDYEYISDVPFEQLQLQFMDGSLVIVHRQLADHVEVEIPSLRVEFIDDSGNYHDPYVLPIMDDHVFDKHVKNFRVDLLRVDMLWRKRYWIQPQLEKTLEYLDELEQQDQDVDDTSLDILANMAANCRVFSREGLLREYPSLHNRISGDVPDWFRRIQEGAGTKLVATNRLTQEFDNYELAWTWLIQMGISSGALQDAPVKLTFPGLTDAISNIASGSRIERDFLRISKEIQDFDIKIDELETALDEEAVKKSEFVTSVLIEHLGEIEDATAETLLDRGELIDLFVDILNERLLFKSLEFDESEDIYHMRSDRGSEVPFKALSSGEQHLFVLYYQLLFETEPDTLVMIDEPELSMNVVWQRNFLKDLQRIIELRKFDVLIATHSPQIIHDKWDWVVHLGEKVDD